ncbi:MAG TPA: putative quinol monooxygenase [Terriglobales bacterium]|nr:putative quinol monooxygenase [Terriglobales bacterium]
MICLNVLLTVKPGTEAEVIANFKPLTEASRQEPGCLMYIAHQHREDPTRFLVYEQYKDDAALDAHRDSPHFKQYAAEGLYRHVTDRQFAIFRPL